MHYNQIKYNVGKPKIKVATDRYRKYCKNLTNALTFFYRIFLN